MRKSLRVVALLIPMVLVLSNSYAATKAGSPCKKLKFISISNGKIYTCIKSGKKLVWDKGSLITTAQLPKTPEQSPTPKPSESASPLATPSKSPEPSAIQIAKSAKAPTSFEDLVSNYQGIAFAAWSKSRETIQASSKSQVSLNLVLGPNTQLAYKEPEKPMELITRLYPGFATSAEIYYLAFNFDDREWAKNQMESILPNSGSQWIYETACKTKETCWGGGAFSNGQGKYLIVETMGFIDANHTSGSLEAHEFTHIVQQMTFKNKRPAQAFLFDPWPPTWYWEGQAHFSQHASVYFDSFDLYMQERRATAEQLYKDPVFNSTHIQNYFVFNAPEDWQKNYDRWHQYDLGAMFVEILTALKGPESTMEMWRLTGTGMNFTEAFEKIYGISFDSALPIMAKAMALELGRS